MGPVPLRRIAALVAACAIAACLSQVFASGGRRAVQVSGPVSIPADWVAGFASEIAGDVISYPSAYPGQIRTLLTRATDGRMRIEWEARPASPGPPDAVVNYVWHAGLASGYGAHAFTFAINGTPCVTFRSGHDTNDREWSIKGDCGATVAFKTTKVGNFNELFGLMVLSAPRRALGTGRPRFSVVGEAAGSQDYYLVFTEPVGEWIHVVPEQAVLRNGRRALRVEISHIGDDQPARVLSGRSELWTGTAAAGYTSALVPAPDGPRPEVRSLRSRQLAVTVDIGGRQALATTVTLNSVRRWTLHLLPHSHVDIGYSDPQPEVERKQWKNLREAVVLARKTAAYPREARFKWNVEGLWSVVSYLQQAPESERAAFVAAVQHGSIGLQANYTNILTGLASPDELTHWTDAARQLRAAYGFGPIRSTMHSDIPGVSWPSVDALAEGGVRYFSSGPNYVPSLPDGGDRIGETLHALGDRPFWWVSPSGQHRVLFWMAGHGYSWFHGLNMGSLKRDRGPILDYLRQLDANGYQWDMVQVRYTVGGDNGPIDPDLPDFVKAWNETFLSPTLVIDTAEGMFSEFERRYGRTLPVKAGDMTPYWEDGAVSSAAEEAQVRASARRLVQAETLWALRDGKTFPSADAAEAWRNVLLWHEHTWGAAASISEPDRPDVVAQWLYKRQFAVEANQRSQALLDRATRSVPMPAPETTGAMETVTLDVANSLSWPRGGVVVMAANLTTGRDHATDANGRVLSSQRLKDGRLAVLMGSVPAFGAVRLTLGAGEAASRQAGVKAGDLTLDNDVLHVAVDRVTGDVRSLHSSRAPGTEFASASRGLNSYLYVAGRDPSAAVGSGAATITIEEAGPLVATLRVESDAPGARSLARRLTLVAGRAALDIEDAIDKTAVRTKESAHIAFPFNLTGAVIRIDEGSAVVVPDQNQLAGSCRDFVGAHSAVDVSSATAGIALATLDAPLVEIGALTDERQDPKAHVRRWRTTAAPGSTVYAYLLNNYWHTNYKADQSGRLVFRFAVQPHGGLDEVGLRRFSAEQEQPLVAYAVSSSTPVLRAPFHVEGTGIVASSIRAGGAGGGMIVRLYNASRQPAVARIVSVGGAPIRVSTVTPIAPGGVTRTAATRRAPSGSTFPLRPFETVAVRVQ